MSKFAVAALCLCVISVVFWYPQQVKTVSLDSKNPSSNSSAMTKNESTKSRLPSSLSGVDWQLAERSSCVASAPLKDWFDTVLTTLGEWSQQDMMEHVSIELARKCTSQSYGIALDLWQRYLDYQTQLAEFDRITESLSAFRLRFFSPAEYDIWFGEEDQYDEFMRAQLALSDRQDLTAEQIKTERDSLEAQLPEEIRATRQRAQMFGDLNEHVNRLRASGESEESIFDIREAALGTEAAQNLAELDNDRAQWKRRLDDLKQYGEDLRHSGISQQDRLQQLDSYMNHHFNELEKKRANAILGFQGAF